MRVGIVTPRYPPNASGGGEVSTRMLAEALTGAERVDEVVVQSFDGEGVGHHRGVEVRRPAALSPTVTELQNLRAYRHVRRFVRKFDVVHAYNMELHPVVGATTDRLDVPAVGTLNSYHFFPKSVANATPGPVERVYELVGHPTTGRILQRYVRKLDRTIAISDAVRRVYAERGYDPDRIDVIPNMLDPEFAVPDDSDPVGADDASGGDAGGSEPADETVTVLYVGELAEHKGVEHLVRAVADLPANYRLRVVGDGDRRADLEAIAAAVGVADRTTFAGWVDYEAVPAEYARADVFVHPGVWPEPFGRTVLEAMQAELPVVCTEIGGPADVVRDEELRVPPGDPGALAGAIERAAAAGPDLGRHNREHVESEYAPGAVTERIVDLYERVVAGE